MTSCGSNIFLTRILQSVFGSTLLACATGVALSLPMAVVGLSFDPRSVLNAPLVLAAVVASVVVSSRRYARITAVSTNRFGRFVRGLSVRSCSLAALCSAVAWALSALSPFRGDGADSRSFLHLGCAVAGVLYHYENVYFERDFHFPIVQTAKYAMFTSGLPDIVRRSTRMASAYVPFVYVVLYAAEPRLRYDIHFAFAIWFSVSMVLFLLYSFELILYLNMTQRFVFPIVAMNSRDNGVSLLGALNSDNKIIKSLALYDLYQATFKDAKRRKEIFSLSFAGNVPQSWKTIFNFCISNIKSTTEDMTDSVKNMSPKLFHRRNIPKARLLKINDASCCKQGENNLTEQKKTINFLENIYAYNYLFGQLDNEKSLEEFEITVWCCYILSNLAVVSLKEDEYGVVREQLGDIVSAILNLKSQLELQRQVNLQMTKKLEYLKIHIKTCAVMLALNFGMYADDIGLDETQLLNFKKLITSLST